MANPIKTKPTHHFSATIVSKLARPACQWGSNKLNCNRKVAAVMSNNRIRSIIRSVTTVPRE